MSLTYSEIAKNFADDVSTNLSNYVDSYIQRFGKSINTDLARELCDEYCTSLESRAYLAPLIHEPASQIAKTVWNVLLSNSSDQSGVVIFLAGGPGSGKSTVANHESFKEKFHEAIIVYDSTFSKFDSAIHKIQDALSKNKEIDIFYIYRNAEDSAYSIVERAVESGRTIPIEEIVNMHWGAQQTIFQLCDQYRYSNDVVIHLFDNRGTIESFNYFDDEEDLRSICY